jgi:hypothetical protein
MSALISSHFSEDMRALLSTCLRLASEKFTENAKTCRLVAQTCIAEQFDRQQMQADVMANIIDAADHIIVNGDADVASMLKRYGKL